MCVKSRDVAYGDGDLTACVLAAVVLCSCCGIVFNEIMYGFDKSNDRCF